MNNIDKLNKIQNDAIKYWIEAGKKGTVIMSTGLGKSFVALHALYTMPRDSKRHLFLAEAVDRKKDLKEQIEKYNKIFDRNVLEDYRLEFHTYQSAYKWKRDNFGLVALDEAHENYTPKYSLFHKYNNYDAVIGLSATINKSTKYELSNGRIITKGMIMNRIAPICFEYNLKKANKENTARDLEINVIITELNDKIKHIKAGNKKKRFYQTEVKAYNYWNNKFKKSLFIEDEEKRQRIIYATSRKRSNIIYNSIGKIQATKQLLEYLKSKTIIFANSLDSLYKITDNIISSRNSEDKNKRIRKAFENNKINHIGSFKKLKQGANLNGLDNVILMSYYSSSLDMIQRIGRLRKNGKIGKVFILLTKDTQEVKWFNKMIEQLKDRKINVYDNINQYLNNDTNR